MKSVGVFLTSETFLLPRVSHWFLALSAYGRDEIAKRNIAAIRTSSICTYKNATAQT